jgi:hypothetical protein
MSKKDYIKWYKWVYSDGSSVTQEHFEPIDGKWKYGNEEIKVFKCNYKNPMFDE